MVLSLHWKQHSRQSAPHAPASANYPGIIAASRENMGISSRCLAPMGLHLAVNLHDMVYASRSARATIKNTWNVKLDVLAS